MWPFTIKAKTVEELISEIPIRVLRENLESIESSLRTIRAVKHRINWGHSLESNDLAFEVMNRSHLREFTSLQQLMLHTLALITLLLKRDRDSNTYHLPKDLSSYIRLAGSSLERDIRLINIRVPKDIAA